MVTLFAEETTLSLSILNESVSMSLFLQAASSRVVIAIKINKVGMCFMVIQGINTQQDKQGGLRIRSIG